MRKFGEENGAKLKSERIHISTIFINKQRNFMDEFKVVAASLKSVSLNL